jgi:S1-C subfamily serine protease
MDKVAFRVVVAALAVFLLGLAWRALPYVEAALLSRDAEPRVIAARGDLADDEQATIALFEATQGSVVSVSVTQRVLDPFTRDAFDVPAGVGSGFVWDGLGHVVTNQHVVDGARRATIRLADGSSYGARVIGADARNDLAVLRLDLGPLDRAPEPVAVGTSADLRVGQKVFAIGNPFGLDFTLTTGVVSALERELPTERSAIRGLVQTDAAINPGNSGGPLLDSAGRLIGVNTAIYSPSGSSAGLGFAVPVDTVNRVVPQLIAQGRYAPPILGVVVDARADEMARRRGLAGAMVLDVEPGSPAEAAGLRPARRTADGAIVPGDAIVALGGSEVEDASDLRAALDLHRAGATVPVTVLRGGRRVELEVTLAAG